jgi:hypothetical protein
MSVLTPGIFHVRIRVFSILTLGICHVGVRCCPNLTRYRSPLSNLRVLFSAKFCREICVASRICEVEFQVLRFWENPQSEIFVGVGNFFCPSRPATRSVVRNWANRERPAEDFHGRFAKSGCGRCYSNAPGQKSTVASQQVKWGLGSDGYNEVLR